MKQTIKNTGLYSPEFERDSCGIGFIAQIKNKPSHKIVSDGLIMLEKMEHRGGVAADGETGDGAGIMTQVPYAFFEAVAKEEKITLPKKEQYGVGVLFVPKNLEEEQGHLDIVSQAIEELGFDNLWLRKVPVNDKKLGKIAKQSEPTIYHVFVKKDNLKGLDLNRSLYVLRKSIEHKVKSVYPVSDFYMPSFSSTTIIFKGELRTWQIPEFYTDLRDDRYKSAIALVHSRFSTNTFPEWRLAQPFRFLAHNGEINTIKGNINKMSAREALLTSTNFTDQELEVLSPICNGRFSDSANLDAILELMVMGGTNIQHAMAMLVPEAWQEETVISPEKKAFYEFHSTIFEPWDGPASLVYTDGYTIGASLDRNGLRPSRIVFTKDDRLVLSSEVGVVDIAPENVAKNERLGPGEMVMVDLQSGKISYNKEIKEFLANAQPYQEWVDKNLVRINEQVKTQTFARELKEDELTQKQIAYGFTNEDVKFILEPMLKVGTEPLGSMGNDTALAVFREHSTHISQYVKQLFAQVSNPAIDPIREKAVMSLVNYLGTSYNVLDHIPEHAHKLRIESPMLSTAEFEYIKNINLEGFKSVVVDSTYDSSQKNLKQALEDLSAEVEAQINEGASIVIISNRAVAADKVRIPSLLATGAVHNHLLGTKQRAKASLVIEGGDIIETHHFATLTGFGATAIYPFMAIETMLSEGDTLGESDPAKLFEQYRKAVGYGLRKILSKMGISTIQSYESAQIFEILGLDIEVSDMCFRGTPSRISGKGFEQLEKEILEDHNIAFKSVNESPALSTGGLYQWKRDGVRHLFSPEVIHALQKSTRLGDYELFKTYQKEVDNQAKRNITLRSMFNFNSKGAINIDEVEPIENILPRFATGAMSFGSISEEAHTTIAKAMNKIGAKSNSGEGGEDAIRYEPNPDGTLSRSAIKQVASGRFGVTAHYLVNADEIQIKVAQGAKPGEGGQLPGKKVDETIGRIRHSTPGVSLISPPPHHDIYSIEDLAQLIYDLKNTNQQADINVKLVSESGVGTIAAGVAKAKADNILIAGHDGGTGASPISSVHHAGIPWEIGLAETHQTLEKNGLRKKVKLQTDGQLRSARDLAIAAILGAEEWGISTAVLVVEGCIMMRKCHLNTCPVGVATQNPALRQLFSGQVDHIVNFFQFLAQGLREVMAELGVKSVDELIGRTDLLTFDRSLAAEHAGNIDLEALLQNPFHSAEDGLSCKTENQDHELDIVIDNTLIKDAAPALDNKEKVKLEYPINNQNRTTGAMLSGQLARLHGPNGLAEDTIKVKFVGSAGQSFGAFLAHGITFNLEGEANDYVGKGLSGGRIIVSPNKKSDLVAADNIIVGNVNLYGATSGELYANGKAGERFAVRNSGATAITEGLGDHGCEYMTGGRVIVLGETGKNFAAGMSGGIAYIYVDNFDFASRCNMEMVELETPSAEDFDFIHEMINKHQRFTDSKVAFGLLDNWESAKGKFVKVIPTEYKAVLEKQKLAKKEIA
ncbi:glutamate synthase large subunit [Reichenbachiella agariperforans]|uniref:glutamate synthase large subunit n=1 Tax=Reichenbachiella agariperforans TaxID=156994 RepID=UPI001C080D22|nr:glutamate synthase large subunit [Reichenbachiella agariperforans]MBU2915454.1 glutamate synthase large subunit [Reichenbachiella agariperforans]